jgi:hypothetical protein
MATDNATTQSHQHLKPAGFVSATDDSGSLLIVNLVGLILALASVYLRIFLARRNAGTWFPRHKDDLFCFAATVSLY